MRLESLESRTLLSISTVAPTAAALDSNTLNTAAAAYSTSSTAATTTASAATAASAAAAATTAQAASAATTAAVSTVHLDTAWFAAHGQGPYLLNASNTTYILDTDVNVPGTAFILGGSNVTLDLNQHTVTYGNAAPVVLTNGGFEQGSGRSVPGWDLTSAASAAIAPNSYYFYGNQVLQLTNVNGTQSIVSDPIAIPTANHEYAATLTFKSLNATSTVTFSVIDSVTGAVLGTSKEGVVQFTPTTTNAVRLKIDVTAPQTDTVILDYASLSASRDYGVVASTANYYMPPQLVSTDIQSTMANSQYLTVQNGSIVQGQANGFSSLPIYAEYAHGLTVKNVNTMSTGIDTAAIDAKSASMGVEISGCVFRSTSDKVTNRQAMVGAQVQVCFSPDAIVVENNQFYGSPQVGVFAAGDDNLIIRNNTIQSKTIVTDGYGIALNNVHNFVISGNKITAAVGMSSRGIMVDGYNGITDHGEIYDNYVDIRERPNSEYGVLGLEATALRMRTWQDAGWHDLHIYNNTFIARTGVGEVHAALGLRIYIPTNSAGTDLNNVIENNTFKAIVETTDTTYYARAVSLEEVAANSAPLFRNNVFESNDVSLAFGGNDGKDSFDGDFISNTFTRSSEGATRTYYAVSAGFWVGSVENIRIIDPKYAGGATPTVHWDIDYATSDGSTRSLAFGWLLTVNAQDALGNPLAGATVTVFDKSGAQVFTGTADASGQLAAIPLVTTIQNQSNTNLYSVTTDSRGPFQVSVSAPGYATVAQTVDLTQSTATTVALSASGVPVTVNAPSGLAATASNSSVALAWTDNATNATSYVVERSIGSAGTWSVLASNLGANATSYTDSSVTAGTTYSYRVRAFSGSTASGYSNIASATAPNALPATPAAPTGLAAAATTSAVSLSWTNNATNATSYSVERSAGSTGVWTVVASGLAATATSYTDSSVTAGTSYSYRVQAFAESTASDYSNVATATAPGGTATLAGPTNLTAAASTSPWGVSLSWTDNATGATSYSIERYSGGTGVWSVVASGLAATATSYTDSSVTPGTFYTYRVEALAGSTGSPYSNAAYAIAPSAALTIPAAPTTLMATAAATSVSLAWADNAANATSYSVERSEGSSGAWTVIASGLAATA
ncbi:MAG: right-handed parallel beta-helix repeat-containing protein, partial [Thermoguttaceae bacterium]